MKISEKWLREWVSPRLDAKALAERLTLAGLEVAALEPAAPRLDKVVVAQIAAVSPHPAAAHLRLCRADAGRAGTFEVVCGASNAVRGRKVPLALPGAVLPGGISVRSVEVHGVLSHGMLCSAAELGLEEASGGLLELDRGAKPGTSLERLLGLDDTILEIDLTPNRGDCLSVAGLAREVAALTGARLRVSRIRPVPAQTQRALRVALRAPADCPRYCGRVIEGIDPHAATPLWMRERLRRSGVRAIHPVVDVTNYVMLELGQPMHAFDLERLIGGIAVRAAQEGEALALLDGRTVRAEKGTLLIADDVKPLALAGIMGGADSAVTADTRHVFLESAWFRPEVIARRARALNIQTESGQRFERGVDPALQRSAIERATSLLLAIVGGRPGPVIEQTSRRYLPQAGAILLRERRIARVLGTCPPPRRTTAILVRLGMRTRKTAAGWRVTPPSWRFDVQLEEDLIEEIARVDGYQDIPSTRPRIAMAAFAEPEERIPPARLRTLLVDRDYHEIITYSFVDPALQALLDPEVKPATLANPISAEMAAMRTSLWPGLLQTIIYNLNRQQERLRFFEIGRRFLPERDGIREEVMLAGAVTGEASPKQWDQPRRTVDFFDAKGDVEALLRLTGRGQDFRFQAVRHPALHPGRAAEIVNDGRKIGLIGELHPELCRRLSLDRPVILYELRLDAVTAANTPVFQEISRYPAIRRDLAVVVPETTPAQAVLDCIAKVAGNLLVHLELFDEYRGKGIDYGRKSLALGLTLQDSSRTLKDTEVEAVMAKVVSALESELGAQRRR